MVSATEEETMEIAPVEVTTSENMDTQTLKDSLKLKETVEEAVTTSEDSTPTQEETSAPVATAEEVTPGDESKSEVTASDDVKVNGGDEIELPKEEEQKESKTEISKPEETTEEIIARFEEEFKDRYTDSDEAHKAVQNMKEASPPVVPNFGSKDSSSSSSTRTSSRDEHSSSSKRTRSRSRSKSPSGPPLKRKGAFGCYSYFVFYY